MATTSQLWEQTAAFSFAADRERKVKRSVAARRAMLPPIRLRKGPVVKGNSKAAHNLLNDGDDPEAEQFKIDVSGIQFSVPEWIEPREDKVFAFTATVIFTMYHKCGGADAVLVLDGCPPVAMLNPCSLAPLQDENFAEVINDVILKRNSSSDLDAGRKRLANTLNPNIAAGSAVVVLQRTVERVGLDVFAQAFDIVYVLEYEGSRTHAASLDIYFNAEVYRDASATNWLQMIQTILSTEDLNMKAVKDLTVLDEEMQNRLLVNWQNPQFQPHEYEITAPQLFHNAMKKHTTLDSVCVVEPKINLAMTYEEVDALSDKVAVYLQRVVCPDQIARFGVDAACALHLPRCGMWYVWMLGILKAGGAYLSLDPDFPANRLSYILEDSGAVCLITLGSMRGSLDYNGPVVAIDEVADEVAAIDLTQGTYQALATPSSPIYMIYTSGSTGKPKGVLVEHRNLVNFVISERKLFHLSNQHRVIQGFSTSFDASLEEIWLAFASGSALICVEKAVMQDAERLQELIEDTKATVLSTVPTLLATMEADRLKQLELVIVGGEACNKEVIEAYATGGKRIFCNSYGPTEATVACCAAFCKVGEPVTIGRAQPGYVGYIVDEGMNLTPPGVPGELCIGGPSVTRGYVNRPDLTREKFVHCPFHPEYDRMYRTGDLCRWNTDGNIEFLGRIDSQVKLRGFRIEIGEIETNLSTYPGVTTAVVVLRSDAGGMPFLCAYLICEPQLEREFSEVSFRSHLKASLPSYMIPSRFVAIKTIPRSPAGKLDRNGFPAPEPLKEDNNEDGSVEKKAPSTETELMLHQVWTKHLPGQNIGINDNFFEIGGHSLLAGKVASEIRKKGFDGFSIRYLYSHPTIEALGLALDSMKSLKKAEPVCTVLPFRKDPSALRRTLFMSIHLAVMHIVFCIVSMYVALFLWVYQYFSAQIEALPFVPQFLVDGFMLSLSLIAISTVYVYVWVPLAKWLLIGKFRPGIHSIWSWYFIRWWAVRAFCNLVPLYMTSGTAWSRLYLRMMGMKVGNGAVYFPGGAFDFDLIEIGDDSCIGHESALSASEVVDSLLILKPIKIGHSSTVGVRCCVKGGAVIGNECRLQHLSLLHENMAMKDGEMWAGSPAQLVGKSQSLESMVPEAMQALYDERAGTINDSDDTPNEKASLLPKSNTAAVRVKPLSKPTAVRLSGTAEFFLMLFQYMFGLVLGIMSTTPLNGLIVALWRYVDRLEPIHYPIFFLECIAGAPFAVAALMLYTHTILVIMRWIVLPWKVTPGYYPVTGLMYHRKVMFDLVMRNSLMFAHAMYASIYVQYFLKALGAEVGERVECSNLYGFTPGLVKFGNETFVADFVGVNPPEIFRGVMYLGRVEIQDRAFVGNGAVLSAGRTLGARSLLGLLSHTTQDLEEGSTYIGSPAFHIPRQAQNQGPSTADSSTYAAPCHLVVARCIWEFFRSVSPSACLLLSIFGAFCTITGLIQPIFDLYSYLKFISLFVWLSGIPCFIMLVIIKWVVVGKEKPSQYPLWSAGVWRAEFVVDCTTVLGGSSFLQLIRGTPLMPWFFRCLGAKIGKGCFIDTMFLTEPDMVTIGDYCCIGDRVTIQTHLFEDRVMKLEPLTIGDRVSIGALSIVLYNTSIDRGCTIGPLSLVMKGESYPAYTHWEGVPAQRRGIPAVMAVAPASVKPITAHPVSVAQRETRPSSIKPQQNVDVAPLKSWLLDDGLQDQEDTYY